VSTPQPETDKVRLVIRIDKKVAAIAQLETAILLWFHDGDFVSIHTLAVASNDCYHAMAKIMQGKASILQTWLKTQSKGLQKRVIEAQNFFKHGHHNLKGEIRYPPIYGEMLLFDSIVCHGMINKGVRTPLMRLYAIRFWLENAEILKGDMCMYFLGSIKIGEISGLSREEFYKRGLRLIAQGN
jgi:hypothetical protein